MPTCTASKGPSMAPATAHMAAPKPNTRVNKRWMLMPMAMAMSRLDAPARTHAPMRVWVTTRYKNKAKAKPTPMMTSR